MAGSGSFTVSRAHGGDRFYNPQAMRQYRQQQQLLLQQQQQLQRPLKLDSPAESDNRTASGESTLSKPSACPSSASPPPLNLTTNLDRLMESITPFVPTQYEPAIKDWRNRESEFQQPFFSLGDLWETFKEWSVYGVGVPLLLNGKDSVMQYYVPFLSGMQLYIDPSKSKPSSRLRQVGGESDFVSSREATCNGGKLTVDGGWNQHNAVKVNSQRLNRLSLSDKLIKSSLSDESNTCILPELPVFEYLEQEQPHHRKPLSDKISALASQFPELRMYRSCDLLPSSWLSVAWYPIYRIPVGPTLQNLDASFLTFHSLSTHFKGRGQPQVHSSKSRKAYGVNTSSKFSLPVFGLASYKLKGSILTPNGTYECQQENSLMQAADSFLKGLQVDLPDYRFFLSHNSQWR